MWNNTSFLYRAATYSLGLQILLKKFETENIFIQIKSRVVILLYSLRTGTKLFKWERV